MNPDTQHFTPLFPKCLGLCMGTFILLFCSVSIAGTLDCPINWLVPVSLAVLHCILVAFSIFRWNTRVYLDNQSITQIQWGKKVVIPYCKISRVKKRYSNPAPYTITIFSDQNKIAFDSTKEDLFVAYCTNQEINAQIKMLQKI